MATLNSKETEQLLTVKAALENILRNGYEPAAAFVVETEERKKKMLEESVKSLHTVIQMKGYYPS